MARPSVEPLEARCVPDASFASWRSPVNLGPTVNTGVSDQHPAISKDGLSLYITTNRPGGFGGDDIWVSCRDHSEAPWEAPVNLGPVVNSAGNDRVPTFSRDGHWMFFGSTRPGGAGGLDLWASYRTHTQDDFDWQAPVNLGPLVNSTADDDGPTLFENDGTGTVTLYFTSNRPGGAGDFDIYSATLSPDGTFAAPVLVGELSGPGRDTRTALRKDGLEMLFTSNRSGSLPGADGSPSLDLWVSTRATPDDPWSAPVNLGPTINTAFADGAPALSSDATTLYFYSTRPGGSGSNDLYMTMRDRTPGGGEGDSSLVEFSRASGRSALPVSGSLHQPAARNQASHAGPAGEAVLSASAFIPSFAAETRVLPPVGVSLTGPRAAREVPPAPVPSQPSTALICRKAGGRQDEYLTAALLSGTAGQAAPGELSAATLDHVFAGLPDEGLAARSGGTPWW